MNISLEEDCIRLWNQTHVLKNFEHSWLLAREICGRSRTLLNANGRSIELDVPLLILTELLWVYLAAIVINVLEGGRNITVVTDDNDDEGEPRSLRRSPPEEQLDPVPRQLLMPQEQQIYCRPISFQDWTRNNNGVTAASGEHTTVTGEATVLPPPLTDEAVLYRDIDMYNQYLLIHHEGVHVEFLEIVQRMFAVEEEGWTFVPMMTPELNTHVMDFGEWRANNDHGRWSDSISRYRQYLETDGTPQHVTSFVESRERLARNQRRTIEFATGGDNEPYELDPWQMIPGQENNFLHSEEDYCLMADSSPFSAEEVPLTFREWMGNRLSEVNVFLSLSEALESDVDTYEHEYLGQTGNSAIMLQDFRNMRRCIRENEESTFDFIAIMSFRACFRVYIADVSPDIPPSCPSRDDWNRAVRLYPIYLDRAEAHDTIQPYTEARDLQARLDRVQYEGGAQEDQSLRHCIEVDQAVELTQLPAQTEHIPLHAPIDFIEDHNTVPDREDESAREILEERDYRLRDALESANHVATTNRDHRNATVKRLVSQAITEVIGFICDLLNRTQLPSLEQWEWISQTIEEAELILHGRLSPDNLDMSGPPPDAGDIIGIIERQRRRIERRNEERRVRQRMNERPRTPDTEALESDVSDDETGVF